MLLLKFILAFFIATLINLHIFNNKAFAHCDAIDGPVVKAAQSALQTSDVNPVLPWVRPEDEWQIKNAFNQTLEVRKMSETARELADRYFFETLVRIHRAGEGAPYTGLKPAGLDKGPAITAAEAAIKKNSTQALEKILIDAVRLRLNQDFNKLIESKNFDKNNIEAGRQYVENYIVWLHYITSIYDSAINKETAHPNPENHNHRNSSEDKH